ncbi:MAG: YfiR family protein [Rhodocyclaceae bacterium]|nr:YfiR family protein [Rhodocyclaceae bacterium]
MRRLLILLCVFVSLSVAAEPLSEYQLKAGFAYNIAAYTEWPATDRRNFNFCTLNEENVGLGLAQFEGKQLHGRRLVIARLTSLVAIRQCQVLYIGEREAANLPHILKQLGDESVLTISDASQVTAVCVRLALDGERLVFDINLEHCQQARLMPGSNLMRLARVVTKP